MTTTTLQPKLTDVSYPTGVPSKAPKSADNNVIVIQVNASQPLPIPNTTSIDEVISEFSTDPIMAQALQDARRDLVNVLYQDTPTTLSKLRLSAGLSQSQLADKAETSQPYIARIESGRTDPSTDAISKIALALNVDEATLFSAIRNQRRMRDFQHE